MNVYFHCCYKKNLVITRMMKAPSGRGEWMNGKKPTSLDTATPQTDNTVVPTAALISVETTNATGSRAPSNSGEQNNGQ